MSSRIIGVGVSFALCAILVSGPSHAALGAEPAPSASAPTPAATNDVWPERLTLEPDVAAASRESLAAWIDRVNESERTLAVAQETARRAVLTGPLWAASGAVSEWKDAIDRHQGVAGWSLGGCGEQYRRTYANALHRLRKLADDIESGVDQAPDPLGLNGPAGLYRVKTVFRLGPRAAMRLAGRIFDTGMAGRHDVDALWAAVCEPRIAPMGPGPQFDVASTRGSLRFGKPVRFPGNEYVALATNTGARSLRYATVMTHGERGSRRRLGDYWGYQRAHLPGETRVIWMDVLWRSGTSAPRNARVDARQVKPLRPEEVAVARDVLLGCPSLYAASVSVVVVPWRNLGSMEARVTYIAVGTRAGVPMMYAQDIQTMAAQGMGLVLSTVDWRGSGRSAGPCGKWLAPEDERDGMVSRQLTGSDRVWFTVPARTDPAVDRNVRLDRPLRQSAPG